MEIVAKKPSSAEIYDVCYWKTRNIKFAKGLFVSFAAAVVSPKIIVV